MSEAAVQNEQAAPAEAATGFCSITGSSRPFVLRSGQTLSDVVLAYETYGRLSPEGDNAILLFHALTGSQHAAGFNPHVPGVERRWTEDCHYGWWDDFIGPGRALDTDRFFVVCANYLGGCYGSTGPCSINPETGEPYGGSFPWIGIADIVDSQVLLLRKIGVRKLHAVVGGSLGGIMAVSLATRYPDLVTNVVSLASGLRVTMFQRVLNFEQICAIENDPAFNSGDYYRTEAPSRGLALARMIGHKTFVSLDTLAMRARGEIRSQWPDFGEYRLTHPVESYMLHQGQKFVERFDANTYLALVGVWQNVELLRDARADSLETLFSKSKKHRYLIFSVDSDGCFPTDEQVELARALETSGVDCRHITVRSQKGHDAFLIEPELFSPYMRYFLS